jgi:inorganic pyrophosphatase
MPRHPQTIEMSKDYWSRLDELIESSEIVMDRPKGTRHPKAPDMVFPVDYGYLKNTVGGDGHEIDVWMGTAEHRRLTAIACTVDTFKRDAEIKLIIGCTDEEFSLIENFHNNQYMSDLIIRRDNGDTKNI